MQVSVHNIQKNIGEIDVSDGVISQVLARKNNQAGKFMKKCKSILKSTIIKSAKKKNNSHLNKKTCALSCR